jgi:S1-C subfamily serine protease
VKEGALRAPAWLFCLAAVAACDRDPHATQSAQPGSSPPTPAPIALDPDVLFRRVSPSIVVIHTQRVFSESQGSGVVIARERVVTNVHVLERSVRAM